MLLFGIGWTAVLTILTPVFTIYGDFPALVATRVLEGIGEVLMVYAFILEGVLGKARDGTMMSW